MLVQYVHSLWLSNPNPDLCMTFFTENEHIGYSCAGEHSDQFSSFFYAFCLQVSEKPIHNTSNAAYKNDHMISYHPQTAN